MNRFILFTIALTLMQNAFSQEVEFNLQRGEVKRDKITKRTFGIESLGYDGEFAYFLYLPYQAVFDETSIGGMQNHLIARFDRDLNEVGKQEIILENDNRKRTFHGVSLAKNRLYLFSAFQNEEHKKHYLFVQTINKETLLPEDNMRKIGEIDYSGVNKYYETQFHQELSPDSTKILVYYNLVNKDDENIRYGMYVYSSDMELIWKKEHVVPEISGGVFSFQRFRIDNEGNVYLKGTNFTDLDNYYETAAFKDREFFSKDIFYADVPNYVTQLYRFSADGTQQHVNISLPDKFVRSLTFLPEADGALFCAGVWSDPGTISARGTFTCALDFNSKKISQLNSMEFGQDMIELGFDEKELQKFRKSIDNKQEWDPFDYLLSDVMSTGNGDKYFVAEQYIRGTKIEKSGHMITYRSIFLHNDLFVTRLNEDNSIGKIQKISKRQYGPTVDHFNSYALLEKENHLYFAFMEIMKKNTMLKNAEPGNTYLVELSEAGSITKSVIPEVEAKNRLFLLPGTGMQVWDHELIYSTITTNFKDYSVEKIILTPNYVASVPVE
ncbi:MAG: hypothetical protein ABFS38_21145 [Bacteroidota bacterium]